MYDQTICKNNIRNNHILRTHPLDTENKKTIIQYPIIRKAHNRNFIISGGISNIIFKCILQLLKKNRVTLRTPGNVLHCIVLKNSIQIFGSSTLFTRVISHYDFVLFLYIVNKRTTCLNGRLNTIDHSRIIFYMHLTMI